MVFATELPFLWTIRDDPCRSSLGYLVGSFHILDREFHTALGTLVRRCDKVWLEHDTAEVVASDATRRALVGDYLTDAEIADIHALLAELGVHQFDIAHWPLLEITSAIRVLLYRAAGAVHRMERTATSLATAMDRNLGYLELAATVETVDATYYADYLRNLGTLDEERQRLRRIMDDYYSGELARALGFDISTAAVADEDASAMWVELVGKRDRGLSEELLRALERGHDRRGCGDPDPDASADGNVRPDLFIVGLAHCPAIIRRVAAEGYIVSQKTYPASEGAEE